MQENSPPKKNQFMNNEKALAVGTKFWDETLSKGLAGIVATLGKDGVFTTADGHRFVNLSCCSYLDFDSHPHVIQGAIRALEKYGVLDHCISRVRVQMPALIELEDSLSALFRAKVITAISASAASGGILPLIASGHMSHGERPVMVFDKNAHFSMNLFKAVCADETQVLTCQHNDMDFLESECKKHKNVAYVCDGTYSMGGHAPLEALLALQDKYGLFLYFDDSHSISVMGEKGEGYIRSGMAELHERTIIVATLNKAFGSSGAAIMFGPKVGGTAGDDPALMVERFAGPLAWSQPMNTAAIGGSLASAELHNSPELKLRQERLRRNIELFDSRIATAQAGQPFPIKLVGASQEKVMAVGLELYREGFYVSPVFFPIVARDKAGLRVMLRSSMEESEVLRLCQTIQRDALY